MNVLKVRRLSSIRRQSTSSISTQRMARPVGKQFLRDELTSLRQRIRSQGITLAKMEIRALRAL